MKWTPVKSYTGFKRCRQCGQYKPNIENGRCAECRGVQVGVEKVQEYAGRASTAIDTNKPTTELQEAAISAIKEHGGLRPAARAISEKLGMKVNHGVIGLAAKGADFPKARKVLGIPPRTVPVPPCAECGKVHERLHTCPHELQKARTRPRRYRLHYECGRGDAGAKHKAELQAEWEAAGCDSFTEWVDAMRLELKIRSGVCPDCGNDSCMADGLHGLWCPQCDASYLLNRREQDEI